MRLPLRQRFQSETGSELVEFAVIGPLLLVLLLTGTDYARVFHTAIQLNDGARAGAQYGSRSLINSGDTSGMQTVATNAMTISGVSTAASRSCQCASDNGTFSPTTPANSCLTPPASACPSNSNRVVFVTVSASKPFSMIIPLPGVPSTMTLTRTATMRVVPF